jgi:hypothetical protein
LLVCSLPFHSLQLKNEESSDTDSEEDYDYEMKLGGTKKDFTTDVERGLAASVPFHTCLL